MALLSNYTDGLWILRVAHEYTPVSGSAASGTAGGYRVYTRNAPAFNPANFPNATNGLYVRISQAGLPSTVNVVVSAVGSDVNGPYIDLDNVSYENTPLAANYTSADVAFSEQPDAANNAESVLYAYNYSSTNLAGTISGAKSAFTLQYTGLASDWTVGGVYKITEANKATTEEIRVSSVISKPVTLPPWQRPPSRAHRFLPFT